MSATPRATVLIGTLNYAHLIGRAIDAILAQTLTDIELIVIDDGSTDDTESVVAGFSDHRLRYLRLDHVGIAKSLNIGLKEARAPFVAINDADDWSLPDRLARQVATLESDPTIGVVGCLMREVDDDGTAFGRRRLPVVATGDVGSALLRFNQVSNTAACLRRDAALAVGGYDPSYRLACDYDLWLRMADHHRIVNLPEELAVRRLGSDNAGQSNERLMLREIIRTLTSTHLRRRSLRGATGLIRYVVSLTTPIRVKQAVRRRRGQAPV
jgi:glycosyltransferase involved in cell wall biosynthesis